MAAEQDHTCQRPSGRPRVRMNRPDVATKHSLSANSRLSRDADVGSVLDRS